MEKPIVENILAIRRLWPRFGYRWLAAGLRPAGWRVNRKQAARICRKHGLQILPNRHKRRYLGSADGGVVSLEAERAKHTWAVDFGRDRAAGGRVQTILSVVDECTRECLALKAGGSIRATDLCDFLRRLFIERGMPTHGCSDNGSDFVANELQRWIGRWGVASRFIAPGRPGRTATSRASTAGSGSTWRSE